MDLMFAPLKKYADFQGRARRSEYWLFSLFLFVVYFLAAIVGVILSGGDPQGGAVTIILAIFGLAVFIPSLAVGFRRLHDTNRSAWWLLIGLIPFVGGLVLFIFYLLDGTPGDNRFGPDPKGRTGSPAA